MEYIVATTNGHTLYTGNSRKYAQRVAREFCRAHTMFTVIVYGNGGWKNGEQIEYEKTYKFN